MGKEVTVISLLLLSLMGASKFAYGAPSSYLLGDTAWLIDGNVKATLDSPNLVKLSTTLPKLATFATLGVPEIFVFHGDGTFEGTATWTQSGNNFVIHIDELGSAIQDMLGDSATVTATKTPSFSGKVTPNGSSITGTLSLGYDISADVETDTGTVSVPASFTLTMKFKGTPTPLPDLPVLLAQKNKTSKAVSKLRPIKKLISRFKALVSRKTRSPRKTT